jgi:hypothetical protein
MRGVEAVEPPRGGGALGPTSDGESAPTTAHPIRPELCAREDRSPRPCNSTPGVGQPAPNVRPMYPGTAKPACNALKLPAADQAPSLAVLCFRRAAPPPSARGRGRRRRGGRVRPARSRRGRARRRRARRPNRPGQRRRRASAIAPRAPSTTIPGAPGSRIYVGSKAPWDAITDALPRYEENGPV